MHAQRQGAATSWAVRGLQSQGAQTQYCELWVANLCGKAGGGGAAGPCCPDGCADGLDGAASGDGSVLCAPQSSAGTAASEDGSPRAVSEAEAVELAAAVDTPAAPARVLPLPALRQQIRDLYQAKALHDIAVARGQRPFLPLADFLACHLALQAGVGGPTVQQRAAQLQTSVAAHAAAGDREVALFGLAAGMLEEAPCGACGCSATGDDSSGGLLVLQPRPGLGGAAASTTAADAVPTVLYHSRRRTGSRAQHELEDALPVLRRYSASAWHAAYLRSAARRPLPQPFDPAGCQQLLPAMAAEIHNLAVGVPGVEQLITWALGSEACPSASLPQLDLGLRLAENQVEALWSRMCWGRGLWGWRVSCLQPRPAFTPCLPTASAC